MGSVITFKAMAVKLKFESDEENGTSLMAYVNHEDQLFIYIGDSLWQGEHVVFERDTAIRFVKHLKAEISKMPTQ